METCRETWGELVKTVDEEGTTLRGLKINLAAMKAEVQDCASPNQ